MAKTKQVLIGLDENELEIIKKTGTYEIPDDIDEIGDKAFWECYDLKKIVIPEKIKAIGKYSFFGCGLKEVTFKNSVPIGKHAFKDCPIESIVIGKNIENASVLVDNFIESFNIDPDREKVYGSIIDDLQIYIEKDDNEDYDEDENSNS